MVIEEVRQGAVTVLKPVGPLSQDDAAQFKQDALEMLGRSLGRFVVDASAIPFVDSKGLEAMVDVAEAMSQSGQALKLCAISETLREVLDLTNLMTRFESYEDANAAVRSFL